MVIDRIQRAVAGLIMTIAGVASSVPVDADEVDSDVVAETPGTTYSRSAATSWSASTRSDTVREKRPRPASSLTIRVVEGFETLRPYYGDDPAYGVDVTAEIEKCPDGNDRISALTIGGWQYEVDGDCSDDSRRGPDRRSQQPRKNDEQESPDDAVLRCDPATWRCRTIDR